MQLVSDWAGIDGRASIIVEANVVLVGAGRGVHLPAVRTECILVVCYWSNSIVCLRVVSNVLALRVVVSTRTLPTLSFSPAILVVVVLARNCRVIGFRVRNLCLVGAPVCVVWCGALGCGWLQRVLMTSALFGVIRVRLVRTRLAIGLTICSTWLCLLITMAMAALTNRPGIEQWVELNWT